MTADEKFMKAAVTQAKRAYQRDETPIGCVIVFEDKIIARGYNKRNWKKNTLAHAEIIAINKASRVLGDWRLEDCTMYVTLEPCPMCAGAVMNARLKRLVYGAFDDKNGACASVVTLFDEKFTHIPLVRSRVMRERCGNVLTDFFTQIREN